MEQGPEHPESSQHLSKSSKTPHVKSQTPSPPATQQKRPSRGVFFCEVWLVLVDRIGVGRCAFLLENAVQQNR